MPQAWTPSRSSSKCIDILDVVGIIQKILHPSAGVKARIDAVATYTVEDGILYVETPVELAGVQVQLNMDEPQSVTVMNSLNGFEQTSAWLTDNDYLFLAYNLSGKTLCAGKHALLKIGEASISQVRLSDTQGQNVTAEAGKGVTRIETIVSKKLLQGGVFNLNGQKVAGKAEEFDKLPRGVYIINGEKVIK